MTKGNIEGKSIKCTDYKLVSNELEEIELERTFGNEKNKLIIQPLGSMVIEFLIGNFDDLFIYAYTENMEKELDKISQGDAVWQDLCRECDKNMKELLGHTTVAKTEIQIDENHTYMIGRYGPVIKHDDNGTVKFKKVI